MDQFQRLAGLMVLCGISAPAHETTTHQKIGDVAVQLLTYYSQLASPARPVLPRLQALLPAGAANEDNDPLPEARFPLVGRYYFHFTPHLNYSLVLPGPASISASGSCSSLEWGLEDAQCNAVFSASGAILGFLGSYSSDTQQINTHRWSQVLSPDSSGAPTGSAVTGFGYTVHLLEDLGSPAHDRNDLHACPLSDQFLIYCNPFERDNFGRSPSLGIAKALPTGANALIPTDTFTTPEQFFTSLKTYVVQNYYSYETVFGAPGGPCYEINSAGCFETPDYFYAPCITAPSGFQLSRSAGSCDTLLVNGQFVSGRKIAHKGFAYQMGCLFSGPTTGSCIRSLADINTEIALEQFDELGPVIAQHVARFIQFYAPALTITVVGSGRVTSKPGNGIDCSQGTCSALFVQGTPLMLTAAPSAGGGITWSGDCAFAGNDTDLHLTLTKDASCTVTFSNFGASITSVSSCARTGTNEWTITIAGTAFGPQNSGLQISATTPNSVNGLFLGANFKEGSCGSWQFNINGNNGFCFQSGPGVVSTRWTFIGVIKNDPSSIGYHSPPFLILPLGNINGSYFPEFNDYRTCPK